MTFRLFMAFAAMAVIVTLASVPRDTRPRQIAWAPQAPMDMALWRAHPR